MNESIKSKVAEAVIDIQAVCQYLKNYFQDRLNEVNKSGTVIIFDFPTWMHHSSVILFHFWDHRRVNYEFVYLARLLANGLLEHIKDDNSSACSSLRMNLLHSLKQLDDCGIVDEDKDSDSVADLLVNWTLSDMEPDECILCSSDISRDGFEKEILSRINVLELGKTEQIYPLLIRVEDEKTCTLNLVREGLIVGSVTPAVVTAISSLIEIRQRRLLGGDESVKEYLETDFRF
ncbi:TPA: hypothetical protein SFZ51_000954 [Campylobacter jejuni]|nr:hypothetical protein [Campylobacter jejuni]HEG8104672.1 hypothetical protein [Campylobacter jejuni]HEG8133835.1 hypothetical protein [Campylobacter jejuni]